MDSDFGKEELIAADVIQSASAGWSSTSFDVFSSIVGPYSPAHSARVKLGYISPPDCCAAARPERAQTEQRGTHVAAERVTFSLMWMLAFGIWQ